MSALNKYTQEEKAALILLGFNWVQKDKEWFNDKNKQSYAFYFDEGSNQFQLRTSGLDWNGDFYEDYEYFNSVNDLVEYLN